MYDNSERISIIWGENDYLKKDYLNSLVSQYTQPEQESFSEVIYTNGKTVSIEELQNTLITIPFFSEFQLVVIYNLFERFKNLANKTSKQSNNTNYNDWCVIVDLFNNLPHQKQVVLVEDQYPENKIIHKDIVKNIETKEFKIISHIELENWIISKLSDNGKTISNINARLIADYVGNDMWTLSNELEKIINFCQQENIEEEHLDILINNPKQINIFKLVDSLLDGNISTSFANIKSVYESGYSIPYLLSMLSRQVRLLLIAKQLTFTNSSKNLYKQKLNIYSDYVIDSIIKQLKNKNMNDLLDLYEKISDLDIAIKTGGISENLIFDNLVANRLI